MLTWSEEKFQRCFEKQEDELNMAKQRYERKLQKLIEMSRRSNILNLQYEQMLCEREVARRLVGDVNEYLAIIEEKNTLLADKFSQIEEHAALMADELKRAEEIYQEKYMDVIEAEERVRKKIEKAKERVEATKAKLQLQEECFAATERVALEKQQKLEEEREKNIALENELAQLNPEDVKQNLEDLAREKCNKEKQLSLVKIEIEKQKENLKNAQDAHKEFIDKSKKLEVLNNEQERNIKKLQIQLKDEQGVFEFSIKSKIDTECKKVYEQNVSLAESIKKELNNITAINAELEDAKKVELEMKREYDELSVIDKATLQSIKKINKDIEKLKAEKPTNDSEMVESLNVNLAEVNGEFEQLQNEVAEMEAKIKELDELQESQSSNESISCAMSTDEILKMIDSIGSDIDDSNLSTASPSDRAKKVIQPKKSRRSEGKTPKSQSKSQDKRRTK